MAKRSKKRITPWMLRKRGIFRRWAQATVKVRTKINFAQIPENYRANRPPKPDKRAYTLHDVPNTKGISVEKQEINQVRVQLKWTSLRHHGLEDFNYKDIIKRADWYILRLYFRSDVVLFIELQHGEVTRKSMVYHDIETALLMHRRKGIYWVEEQE